MALITDFCEQQRSLIENFGYLAAGVPPEKLPLYSSGPPGYWAKHNAHCFNYIRQILQCFADSTAEGHAEIGDPEGRHRSIADDVTHMCNDFDALLKWKNDRIASARPWHGWKH
jgi:hypothetical protein